RRSDRGGRPVKIALLLLGATLIVLGALAAVQGVFFDGLQRSGKTFVSMTPILVVALLLARIAQAALPPGSRSRLPSRAARTPAAGLLGMPLAAGLLKAGAGVGVLVTYLTSMALLPLLRVPMEIGIYGGRLAALRIAASCLLPFAAGFTAQAIARLARG